MSKEKSPIQLGLEELKEKGYDLVIHSYSGYGMSGKTCLAVAGDFDPIEVGFYLGRTEAMKGKTFPYTIEDSSDETSLVYWPQIEYVADEDETVEEEA
jgi:hypothetical protein